MNVLMPQLGETVAGGRITTWFKRVGDKVAPGDNLFEVETDKASMEVAATGGGYLTEIRIRAGAESPVGAIVAVISEAPAAGGGSPSPSSPRSTALQPFREVRTPERGFARKLPGGVAITPLARRLAAEAGIDLSGVAGSGARGRIARADVEAAIRAAAAAMPPAAAHRHAGRTADQVKALYAGRPYKEDVLDRLRHTAARRLVEAKHAIPHFYLVADVALDQLLRLREQIEGSLPQGSDGAPPQNISIDDLVLKAYALALQAVPAANAVWAADRILRFRHSDIGIAVAAEGGVLTPVLRDVEAKSLTALAEEARRLADRARAGRLAPEDCRGGSSIVSNLGGQGVHAFSAIINPPHATVLAVGAAQRRPIETAGGGIGFASWMAVTLSCDHRVIDGTVAAELLAAFREIAEAPLRIML